MAEEIIEQETAVPEETEQTPAAEEEEAEQTETAPEQETAVPEEETEPESVDLQDTAQVSQALTKKGLDYEAFTQEYLTDGKLSDKSMSALAEAGIPKEMVQTYIKGCEAQAEMERNELAQCVGGRETMDEIINWAAKNLSRDEIVTLNSIRNKFELETILIGLKNRMEQNEGKTPNYQKGTGSKTAVAGFRSQAEMFEAIKDPRYNKDEAYRSDVQKKIAAARKAGVDLGIY